MKRLLCAFLMLLLMPVAGAFACAQNEIDVNGDGTNCQTSKFEITTTNLAANTEFRFYMSAKGTFFIDCGEDGTLSGTDVSGKTVTRTTTDANLYTCSYSTSGVKIIRFGGLASGYSKLPSSTISFSLVYKENTPNHINKVSGDLSKIFPYISTNSSNGEQPRFSQLFYGAYNLQSVPGTLFSGYTTAATMMFRYAFAQCSSLEQIPETLFSGISVGASQLFESTFLNCTGLQSIPANLFNNIQNGAYGEFYATFGGCASLSGYIPPSLFARLNNSGQYSTNMMASIFGGTNLDTTCPAGTVQFVTGYENYWDGHVSCVDENLVCSAGEYLPAHGYECSPCPENNYCVGGTYTYSENTAYGATQCPNSWYAPRGMSSADQCGRILHVGENVVYLRNVKKTTPSLNVRVDGYTFYGNMTTADVPMNANTTAHMKVQFNNETYSIYDDTITPQ